jgi:DNA-binding transcriptional MerR regulator
MGELPPKLFFRIGEVAGLVGVEPHVLRYWEREFRSIRPTKSAKGQRVYSRKDVENLLRVRDLLYRDGFTIAGAKKKLHHGADETDAAVSDALAAEPVSASAAAELHEPASYAASFVRVAPESAPETARPGVRETLMALRSEVEAFLAELSAPADKSSGPSPCGTSEREALSA